MAYATHYRLGVSSKNQTEYIYIDEDGYASSIEDLTYLSNSLEIDYKFNGWEDPIIGLACSFSILNDKTDFFELLPLLTAAEKQYRVRVVRDTPSSFDMFSGYLNCENNNQKYLKNRGINLVASSYLSKLQYITPPSIETLQTVTWIDYIDDCLRATGTEDNIRINCSLYVTGDTLGTTKTLFNMTGVYSEVFWKNNVDKDTALDVVKKILTTFDCYIYWYNGYWYIERYEDIFNASAQSYVEYTSGTSYGYADAGSAVGTSDTPIDFASLDPIGQSQEIGTIMGMKEIEIKIDQILLNNFILNDFSDNNLSSVYGTVPYPAYRAWEYWNESPMQWSNLTANGLPWKDISNSIQRQGWTGTYDVHRGIYTRFRATVDTDTAFSFKFKFATIKGVFGSWTGNWEDYNFKFNWYLRHSPGNYFIYYDAGTDTWSRDSGTEATKYNTTEVAGTDFDDGNVSTEVSISVPIGDVAGISGDQDFVFCIGIELVERSGVGDIPCLYCWIGDVVITASSPLSDNVYKGTINTSMLNKLSINVPFSDINSLNIKTGILGGSSLNTRTETWTDDGVNDYPLATMKIKDKFRLYRIVREKITSKISTTEFYKPLRNFTDSNQSGLQFILAGYSYEPERDEMKLTLMEYDNTETITIS